MNNKTEIRPNVYRSHADLEDRRKIMMPLADWEKWKHEHKALQHAALALIAAYEGGHHLNVDLNQAIDWADLDDAYHLAKKAVQP